jgi:hypothetical protein
MQADRGAMLAINFGAGGAHTMHAVPRGYVTVAQWVRARTATRPGLPVALPPPPPPPPPPPGAPPPPTVTPLAGGRFLLVGGAALVGAVTDLSRRGGVDATRAGLASLADALGGRAPTLLASSLGVCSVAVGGARAPPGAPFALVGDGDWALGAAGGGAAPRWDTEAGVEGAAPCVCLLRVRAPRAPPGERPEELEPVKEGKDFSLCLPRRARADDSAAAREPSACLALGAPRLLAAGALEPGCYVSVNAGPRFEAVVSAELHGGGGGAQAAAVPLGGQASAVPLGSHTLFPVGGAVAAQGDAPLLTASVELLPAAGGGGGGAVVLTLGGRAWKVELRPAVAASASELCGDGFADWRIVASVGVGAALAV